MSHYTYFNSLGIEQPDLQKLLTAVAVGIGLVFFAKAARKQLEAKLSSDTSVLNLVPDSKITCSGVAQFAVDSLTSLQDGILGKEGRRYLPLTGTIFLFVFVCNLVGLIPGMPAATTTVWITLAIALSIFFSFNFHGIREQGLVKYLLHFAGPDLKPNSKFAVLMCLILAGFLFVIEVLGTLMRILTLNLRLYWNISADHMVLGIFTDMTQFLIPVVFLVLGLGIAFMQAFVPTVLTMVYLMLATHHGDGEHSAGETEKH